MFFDGPTPRILAHRGLALQHAENTLGAFGAAVATGAEIIETDVHLSKDGQVIVAHDPDLQRVAKIQGLVADFTAAELRDVDLGFGEGFPTLVEALEAFPDHKFNIDLKIRSAVEPFVDLVSQLEVHDRILVTSFDEKTRASAVAKLPGVVSSATRASIIEGKLRSWFGLSSATWGLAPEIKALQVPPVHWGLALVTPNFVKAAHNKGLEVHVWTINEASDMVRLLDMGVDGIITDRCDVAAQVIATRGVA
jgi:glycerophosphoryl diester phosphodiesterase